MSQQQPTEVPTTAQEMPTPSFHTQAPVILARNAAQPDEDTVMAMVPKAFEITLSDGTRRRVRFDPGTYPIPARFSGHFYLKANGVVLGGAAAPAPKPQLEGGADPDAAAKAAAAEAEAAEAARLEAEAKAKEWPPEADIDSLKFDQLGQVLSVHGVSDEDVKALGSKDARRAKIREMIAAEQGNGQ